MRGLATALAIGSVLTCVNQYENLSEPTAMNWYKVALTYCFSFLGYLCITGKKYRMSDLTGDTSSRLQRCAEETRILSELGTTVHDNAQRVNQASTERLEVARNTIEAAEQVIACGAQIDNLSKQNLQLSLIHI